jgi:hypothetical protein
MSAQVYQHSEANLNAIVHQRALAAPALGMQDEENDHRYHLYGAIDHPSCGF